ncbi:MAG TPA: hypothetical protein PL110_09270 [Candidatus Eremiobacteraeota bacterium]|nr:MAG: hypothetical protein BWY64_00159 [bacterium ADurb.Bin363]HPZ08292.1 hypothetical protein [Candidatus Eremiobacteraeota bacterium]
MNSPSDENKDFLKRRKKILSITNEQEEIIMDQVIKELDEKIEKRSKKYYPVTSSKNSLNWILLSLGIINILLVIILIFIIINKQPPGSTSIVELTPSPFTGNLVNIHTAIPSIIPEDTPEPTKTTEPSPTEKPVVVYNPVPTPVIIVEPSPTRFIVKVPTKKPRSVYIPPDTPVPTAIDYRKANRDYCNTVLTNKVIPLYNERKYAEAINECHNLIARDDSYYMNYLWMANCYLGAHDVVDAKSYLDEAWRWESREKRINYDQSETKKVYDVYYRMGGK